MADSPDPEITIKTKEQQDRHSHGDFVDLNNEDGPDDNDSVASEAQSEYLQCGRQWRGDNGVQRQQVHYRYEPWGDDGHTQSSHLRMKPEPYYGKEDWEEYISHFEDCAELGDWTPKERALALAASLRGPARTFYIGLSAVEKRSFDLLRMRLEQRFGSSRQQNRWLSKLEARRRQPEESIAALGDDLRQMAQKAYPLLDGRAQEALALNQLYKSVSLEMKCRCIDRDCQSVASAVEVIERYEAIVGPNRDRGKPAVRAITPYQNNRPRQDRTYGGKGREPSMSEIIKRLEQLEGTTSQQVEKKRNNRSCFICDDPDHFYRECPFRKPVRENNQDESMAGNEAPLTQ